MKDYDLSTVALNYLKAHTVEGKCVKNSSMRLMFFEIDVFDKPLKFLYSTQYPSDLLQKRLNNVKCSIKVPELVASTDPLHCVLYYTNVDETTMLKILNTQQK